MKDLAYKILGIATILEQALDNEDYDTAFPLEEDLREAAIELATDVALQPDPDPLAGHTRQDEIADFARRNGVCVPHAVVLLVNAALSHGLDREV